MTAAEAAARAASGEFIFIDPDGLKHFRQKNDARYLLASQKGANNGLATLDGNGKLTAAQTPLGLDDYIEVDTLPTADQSNTVFYYVKTGATEAETTITKGTAGHTYRWIPALKEGEDGHWADITAVDTANKAVADGDGNVISTTYAKKSDVKTYTAGNNIEISAQGAIGVKAGVYVAVEAGKGLYPDADKEKLAGLKNYTAGTGINISDTGEISSTVEVPTIRAMT